MQYACKKWAHVQVLWLERAGARVLGLRSCLELVRKPVIAAVFRVKRGEKPRWKQNGFFRSPEVLYLQEKNETANKYFRDSLAHSTRAPHIREYQSNFFIIHSFAVEKGFKKRYATGVPEGGRQAKYIDAVHMPPSGLENPRVHRAGWRKTVIVFH